MGVYGNILIYAQPFAALPLRLEILISFRRTCRSSGVTGQDRITTLSPVRMTPAPFSQPQGGPNVTTEGSGAAP